MLHSGPGSGAAGAIADRWSGMAGALYDIQQDIGAGVTGSGATWIGTAGDTARDALGPLGEWAQQASTAADMMRISTELQGDLLAKARADMPAPVPVPQQPGQIGQLVTAQIDCEVAEMSSQLAAQQAAQVMAQYEAATDDNTGTLGDFGEPPQLVVDTTPITGPVVRAPVRVPDAVRSAAPGRGSSASGPAVEEPTAPRPGRQAVRQAPTSVVEPSEEVAPAAGSTGSAGSVGAETPGSVGVDPATGSVGVSTCGEAPAAAPAPAPTTPSGAPPSRAAAGSAAAGSAAARSAAARSAAVGSGVAEAGSTTTSSAAPVGPAVGRDRRTSSPDDAGPTVGTTRYAGGAMVPAARRPDQEDEPDDLVHESKYLIEADDIYGQQAYAPPVIGESQRRR